MIVMKFGGTSVGNTKAMLKAAAIIAGKLALHPIVIVSAMAGVTNQLIKITELAVSQKMTEVDEILGELNRTHVHVACQLIAKVRDIGVAVPEYSKYFSFSDIGAVCAEIRKVAEAIETSGEVSGRNYDRVVGSGELLSSNLFVLALLACGIPAQRLDSRDFMITDQTFTEANPVMERIRELAPQELMPVIEGGRVPVLAGFVGATPDGVPTTIGRGGSDFSAVVLGAALGVEVEIWTDADGLMTADPNVVPTARTIEVLSFNEARELAYFGAKVLHSLAAYFACKHKVQLRILNSNNLECVGTLVTEASHPNGPIKSIAFRRKVTIVNVVSTEMVNTAGPLAEIFGAFHKHGIAVDVVTTSVVSVSATVDSTSNLIGLVKQLENFGYEVTLVPGQAIICLVEDRLDFGEVTSLGRQVLRNEGVSVSMVSESNLRTNLTIVVPESHVERAVTALHDAFFPATGLGLAT
jgi:aspartate kinase